MKIWGINEMGRDSLLSIKTYKDMIILSMNQQIIKDNIMLIRTGYSMGYQKTMSRLLLI